VAVTFVSGVDPGPAARQRFLIEARGAARIQHPNVATIYRVGELGDRPYLVTELIKGRSLGDLTKPIPAERAIEIGIDVARGLAAAHRRNVVHRDLKPENVMITEEGSAKLVDFGMAALVADNEEPAAGARGSSTRAAASTRRRTGANFW
jgi:serine/threonine protein kinase